MKRKIFILVIIIAMAFPVIGQEMTAKEIVNKADQKDRGNTYQGEMAMTIVRPKWERTVEMKSWSKGDEYFLILITAPAKDKGQVFLKRGNEMWNWVPAIERTIKLPPSMMGQSWMGSDFNNDDLVKQSSIVKDYTHTLLGTENIRGMDCYKIELIPLEDAAVVWGKIFLWITKENFNMWKTEFYDEEDYLVSTQNCYDLKDVGDRIIPMRFEIIPADEPAQKTVLEIKKVQYNLPINDSFFTQQNMKKVK